MRPLLFGAVLIALSAPGAFLPSPTLLATRSECCPGDTRCNTDNFLERCWPSGNGWTTTKAKCKNNVDGSGSTTCTIGDERCGAHGRVQRCNDDRGKDGSWADTNVPCQ